MVVNDTVTPLHSDPSPGAVCHPCRHTHDQALLPRTPPHADLGLSGDDSRLKQALADLSPSAVFVVGMPLEFAVRFMALEAAILCRNVYVIEDACW